MAAASLNDQTSHLMPAVSVFELGDARGVSLADADYAPVGSAA